MIIATLVITLLQFTLYLLIAPAVIGTLRWFKARLQGRSGPSPLQPYFDIWKLARRRPVLPETASWVFRAAPVVVFCCMALIGMLTPIVYLPSSELITGVVGPPLADFLAIIYLLAFTHFVTGLAGMDSGSPFGGMGSGREMFLHVLSEPVLVLSVFALALNFHTTSLSLTMSRQFAAGLGGLLNNPSLWLVFFALVLTLLAESGRIPYDNPATHLELTMIGKAIHLEYSGIYLALLEWADAMRLTFFIVLLLNLFFPFSMAAAGNPGWLNGLLVLGFIPKLAVVILILAVWEITRAKMRLRAVVVPSSIALTFSILAVVIALVVNYGGMMIGSAVR